MSELLLAVPAFAFTTLLLVMVPGQGVAMVLRQSIMGGSKAAFLSALGNCAGILTWAISSAIGLSAIFARSHTAYTLLKWSGVIFLVVVSIQTLMTLRNEFGKFDLDSKSEMNSLSSFRLGLVTNLTNVKAAVYAVAFLPAFVPKDFSLGWGIFIFGSIWALVSISWNIFLIWTVKKSATYIQKPMVRRVLTGISALGIMFLAVGLALSSGR
ncbi:RhtB Putative threonine efflux protein [Candidatus Nanopelagicaceae bacterium]